MLSQGDAGLNSSTQFLTNIFFYFQQGLCNLAETKWIVRESWHPARRNIFTIFLKWNSRGSRRSLSHGNRSLQGCSATFETRDALVFGCQESLRGVSFLTAFVLLQVQLFDQAVGLVSVAQSSQTFKGLVKNARRASDKDLVQDATRANAKGLLRDARSQGNHLKDAQNLKGP